MKKNINSLLIDFLINNKNYPIVIYFWSNTCSVCKVFTNTIDEIKHSFKKNLKVLKINIKYNNYLCEKFSITSIPNLIIFKNKILIFKKSGFINKILIKNKLKNLI